MIQKIYDECEWNKENLDNLDFMILFYFIFVYHYKVKKFTL